jgi:hypothetical protein
MTNSTQLLDITNFIVNNFKDHRIWSVEITSPESFDESSDGFDKHGIVDVSATDAQGNWNSHSFIFNSPENVDVEMKSYFTNCTFPLYVNTPNTLLWEE